MQGNNSTAADNMYLALYKNKGNNAIHLQFIVIPILDRIFDTSNSTQDVYDEFGKPTVQSAMDGFNGKMKYRIVCGY